MLNHYDFMTWGWSSVNAYICLYGEKILRSDSLRMLISGESLSVKSSTVGSTAVGESRLFVLAARAFEAILQPCPMQHSPQALRRIYIRRTMPSQLP